MPIRSIHTARGKLKNLIVSEDRVAVLKEIPSKLPDITLEESHMCDLELIATGAFSPIEGFMVRVDYEPVRSYAPSG